MSTIVFRYLHFLGVAFWLGSAVAVALAAAAPTPWESGIAQALRKVTLRVTTIMVLLRVSTSKFKKRMVPVKTAWARSVSTTSP